MIDFLVYFLGVISGAGLAFMAESAEIDQGYGRIPSARLWNCGLNMALLGFWIFIAVRVWRYFQ